MRNGLIGLALALSMLAPAAASATEIYANGGKYFSAYGPSAYWRFDYGQGYCGQFGAWCSPGHAQWTYTVAGPGSTNGARWSVAVPTAYFSRAYAFVPRRNATARQADYTVLYNYGSRQRVAVNQLAYYDTWAPLTTTSGLYRIHAVDLSDLTFGYPTARVSFDEIKIEN